MAAPNAAVDDVVTARPLDGHVVAGTSLGEPCDEALRDPRELLAPAACLAEASRTMAREAGEPAARRAGATDWTHDAHLRDLPGARFVAAP